MEEAIETSGSEECSGAVVVQVSQFKWSLVRVLVNNVLRI